MHPILNVPAWSRLLVQRASSFPFRPIDIPFIFISLFPIPGHRVRVSAVSVYNFRPQNQSVFPFISRIVSFFIPISHTRRRVVQDNKGL